MTHAAAEGGAAPHFDRYSKASDLTPSGDDWFRSYDDKTRKAAYFGSLALENECLKLFERFAQERGLPPEEGLVIQLYGWGVRNAARRTISA